jgi:hypothetical protein
MRSEDFASSYNRADAWSDLENAERALAWIRKTRRHRRLPAGCASEALREVRPKL